MTGNLTEADALHIRKAPWADDQQFDEALLAITRCHQVPIHASRRPCGFQYDPVVQTVS